MGKNVMKKKCQHCEGSSKDPKTGALVCPNCGAIYNSRKVEVGVKELENLEDEPIYEDPEFDIGGEG